MIKKEQGESSFKDVKKEEQTDESPGRIEVDTRKKKTESSKTSKKKMNRKKNVERGESSRGAELACTSKKKKLKRNKVECSDKEFRITNRKSYHKFLVRLKTKDLTKQYTHIVSVFGVICESLILFSGNPKEICEVYPE